MKINFKTLLTLKISHSYYGEDCRDFDFVIPFRTRQLLQDGRLTARVFAGRLLLFFAADGANSLVSMAGRQLCLGIRVHNPYFTNFTRLDFEMPAVTPVYRNIPDFQKLTGDMASALVGPVFSHTIRHSDRPITLRLISPAGALIHAEMIPAGANRQTVSYNLSGLAPGAYRVEEDSGGPVTQIPYYVAPELLQAGILGVVELTLHDSFYTAPPTFVINFNAKKEILKYYVIAKNYLPEELDQFVLNDQGFTKDKRPELKFEKAGPAAVSNDALASALAGNTDVKVILFKSQTEVPRQEKARRNIQLVKNGEVLITNLPQLGADKIHGDIIIHLSKF